MSRPIRANRFWGKLLHRAGLAAAWLLLAAGAAAETGVVYYHTDSLGSVVAATDENAAVLWRESYRPFGERIDYEVSSDENTPFYTGKPHDDQTGLSYFGARDYDPFLGRFTGQDPVGVDPENLHSFNRYAYGNNNPYKYIDPDGNFPFIPIAIWVGKELLAEVVSSQLGVPVSVKGAVKYAAKSFAKSSVGNVAKGVRRYEVGAFDALKGRSVKGDGLDIHHATQKHPAGQVVGGYRQENGPSIAVPRGEHSRIPTIAGEYTGTARDLLAKDIRDLRNYTNAPNSSLRELIDLNKQTYPKAFKK